MHSTSALLPSLPGVRGSCTLLPGGGEPSACLPPTDTSSRISTGECEGEDIWYLQFNDGNGPEFYDEPDLTVGCTGGHNVCRDGCAFEPAEPVHPPEPQMQIDYLNQEVSFNETNIVLEPPSNYCDDPADTCWKDVNTREVVNGFEVYYQCGQ